MYRIGVHVPTSHFEPVKEAMFASSAGRYGKYDRCSWQVLGSGQCRPSAEANPYAGTPGRVDLLSTGLTTAGADR